MGGALNNAIRVFLCVSLCDGAANADCLVRIDHYCHLLSAANAPCTFFCELVFSLYCHLIILYNVNILQVP